MTHYQNALNMFGNLQQNGIELGREIIKAIKLEKRTIREMSIDLCGNESLEDKLGRYVMAAEFADSLNPYQYENVADWLTTTHYTELRKLEQATDTETALDAMQEIVTELPGGLVDVKPVEWLRAKRKAMEGEPSFDEKQHRFWKQAAKLLTDIMSEIERKGNFATKADKRRYRLLKLVVMAFSAEPEEMK